MTRKPTKAQRSLLEWMVAFERRYPGVGTERSRDWRGGDLIDYYHEQNQNKPHGKRRGGYADHGWRRAGGTALKHLADAGYLDPVGFSIGVPIFHLTEAGRAEGLGTDTTS